MTNLPTLGRVVPITTYRHPTKGKIMALSAYERQTAIPCPTCERMGRVTVVRPNGRLTTATCADCNGEGYRQPCGGWDCKYCEAAAAKAQPIQPMF